MDYSKITKEELTKNRPDLMEAIKAEANAALAKEIQEAKDQGKQAESKLLQAQKLDVLCNAGLAKDLHEAVKKSIMPDAISLEEARGIVETWKETAAKLTAKPGAAPDPKVTGIDTDRQKLEESQGELPSDEKFIGAFGR